MFTPTAHWTERRLFASAQPETMKSSFTKEVRIELKALEEMQESENNLDDTPEMRCSAHRVFDTKKGGK